MVALHYAAWFFAGVLLFNAIPHLVSGVTGRLFQSPFAKPPGVGLSSSRANVVWAFVNLAIGWLLLAWVGMFDWREPLDIAFPVIGALAVSLFMAGYFGRFHGGASPPRP